MTWCERQHSIITWAHVDPYLRPHMVSLSNSELYQSARLVTLHPHLHNTRARTIITAVYWERLLYKSL